MPKTTTTTRKRTYLQYITDDKDKLCLTFRSEQKAKEYIIENKIKKEQITYYSHKRFPFRQHHSVESINNIIGYYNSNKTSKRYLKEVR